MESRPWLLPASQKLLSVRSPNLRSSVMKYNRVQKSHHLLFVSLRRPYPPVAVPDLSHVRPATLTTSIPCSKLQIPQSPKAMQESETIPLHRPLPLHSHSTSRRSIFHEGRACCRSCWYLYCEGSLSVSDLGHCHEQQPMNWRSRPSRPTCCC